MAVVHFDIIIKGGGTTVFGFHFRVSCLGSIGWGRGGMILTSFEDAGNLKDKSEGLLAELQGSLAAVHTPLGFELLGVGRKGPQYQCIVS